MTKEVENGEYCIVEKDVFDLISFKDALYERIYMSLAWGDCNCEPGDSTCEDWPDRRLRHEHLASVILCDLLLIVANNTIPNPPGPTKFEDV